MMVFNILLLILVAGQPGQCQVRDFDGAQDRGAGVRAARGHHGGEAEDGDDDVRVPDGVGLCARGAEPECNTSNLSSSGNRRGSILVGDMGYSCKMWICTV